jgi:hypothetical protein
MASIKSLISAKELSNLLKTSNFNQSYRLIEATIGENAYKEYLK